MTLSTLNLGNNDHIVYLGHAGFAGSRAPLRAQQPRRWQVARPCSWACRRMRRRHGLLGVRVSEAGNPGPSTTAQPGTPIHPAIARAGGRQRSSTPRSPRGRAAAAGSDMDVAAPRVYCPVAGCPCSDPARTAGWANHTTIRSHIMHICQAHWMERCQRHGCKPRTASAAPFVA